MVRSSNSRSRSTSKKLSLYDFSMNIWDNYRWELFLCLSIIIIIICWFLKPKDSEYTGISIDTSVLKKKSLQKGIYKNEEKCREIVEKIYNRPFKKSRPDFLKNPKTGRNLELDMYNESLKLAVEYNGIQHRVYAPYFHKSLDDFLCQVERDKLKSQRCNEVGVTLIIVPDTVRYNEMEEYIKLELKKAGRL